MPELPEVETIVRGLAAPIQGARILRTRVLRPDLLRVSPRLFRGALAGRTVTGVARRAKNILISLDSGSRLVVNLGMTGRLLLAADRSGRATHPGVVIHLADQQKLVYDDVRRFGVLEVLTQEQWAAREARFGPEPLEDGFTSSVLAEALSTSRSPVRSWLLDQRRIAGVGNIYAVEALFRAGIHPKTPASNIDGAKAAALRREIRRVLRSAIAHHGTTLRNYRDVDGNQGRNARRLMAYGRAGEPCTRCGDTIQRLVFGNRSAFLCPTCQPA